ncbi:hypothetical protein MW887_006847 [Aspergillus wentii]|nr:hypothetical protein MW887_006847 [Aspergillus wentii]
MAPQKPTLPPLQTPKNMNFPSELYDSPLPSCTDSIKPDYDYPISSASITPPPAYTEFLKSLSSVYTSPASATTSSFPRYPFDHPRPSPISVPSSTTSASFPTASRSISRYGSTSIPPPSPASAVAAPPHSARGSGPRPRHLRLPPSYIHSPSVESPRSASTIRSPYSPSDWKMRHLDSPRSADGRSFSVRQVVTQTITYKRAPPLHPPPPGKRKRNTERRDVDN